jgi:glycerophosphoryl diester phosphodiesterase
VTVQTLYHADGSELTVVRTQDVEPILEHNKTLRTIEQRSDWGRHVASVPNVVLEKWLNEELDRGNVTMQFGTDEFYQMVERKLRDPEYRAFRTDASFNGFLGFGS